LAFGRLTKSFGMFRFPEWIFKTKFAAPLAGSTNPYYKLISFCLNVFSFRKTSMLSFFNVSQVHPTGATFKDFLS